MRKSVMAPGKNGQGEFHSDEERESPDSHSLNEWAASVVEDILHNESNLGCRVHDVAGAMVIDCGVAERGSVELGQLLTLVSMSDLGDVEIQLDRIEGRLLPKVHVNVPDPTVACLLSQYAGWKISAGKYFAMGSGPMRALYAAEKIFEELHFQEIEQEVAVGVLEASELPPANVVKGIAKSAHVHTDQLLLLVARTASLAGSYQVVARSLESCMHKLHTIGFDVMKVRSGIGSAFLPPIPTDDLVAIGRTNDSILYGGEVMLWVDASDEEVEAAGAKLPSSSSSDYGQLFADLFQRYGGDFYKIDPMLFSPAKVAINNLATGRYFEFGEINQGLLMKSFFG
jgi:methenyltetrahydromethanopterin cyclohydrolase